MLETIPHPAGNPHLHLNPFAWMYYGSTLLYLAPMQFYHRSATPISLPKCPMCGSSACVASNGWSDHALPVLKPDGTIIAILSYRLICNNDGAHCTRKSHTFNTLQVLDQFPAWVQSLTEVDFDPGQQKVFSNTGMSILNRDRVNGAFNASPALLFRQNLCYVFWCHGFHCADSQGVMNQLLLL